MGMTKRFSFFCFLFMMTVFVVPLFGEAQSLTTKRAVVQVVHPTKKSYHRAQRTSQKPHESHPLIILDAGHGGRDQGAKVQNVLEKRLCLTSVFLAKRALENLGYRVILTRSRDVYLSLARRVSIANKMEGALFVSIHFNSAESTSANGVEVFYFPSKKQTNRMQESKLLANSVLYQVIDQTTLHSRGVKQGNHHVTRETAMPAILIEGGFMTNSSELDFLKDRTNLAKLAEGIARGVDHYLKS
jgi:N-acetylmuramoyl-L-alanine amidase